MLMRLSQLRLRWRAIITRYQQQGLALILRRVMRRATRVAFALVSLVGCTISAVTPTQPPTFSSATAEPTAQPAPTAQPTPTEDGWQALSPGIERQILRPPGTVFARLAVIRINPSQVTIRAHYRPGDPLLAAGWADALPDAAVIINANFFDREIHGVFKQWLELFGVRNFKEPEV